MALVIDASIVGCWCFPDEVSSIASEALDQVGVAAGAVPALWWFEVRNMLLVNERRSRLDAAGTAEFLADLVRLPIHVDREPDDGTILELARAHGLTFYDASYLELARRLDATLATLDHGLAAAARAAAVRLLGEERS